MSVIDFALRSVGAFYLLGGGIAMRAALTSRFLDQALAQISQQSITRKDQLQFSWLAANAVLIGIGGIAAAILWSGAVVFFLLGAAGQLAYLTVLAPRYFDRDDPPDPKGRRQTTNAFLIYLAATAFVISAGVSGILRETHALTWQDGTVALVLAVLGLSIPFAGRFRLWGRKDDASSQAIDDDAPIEPWPQREPGTLPKRIVLSAEVGGWPTWEYGMGLEAFDPAELPLSVQLHADIKAWADAHDGSIDMDDPGGTPLWSEERYSVHYAAARPLAERIARELDDRGHGYIDVGYWDPDEGTVWVTNADQHLPDKSASGG